MMSDNAQSFQEHLDKQQTMVTSMVQSACDFWQAVMQELAGSNQSASGWSGSDQQAGPASPASLMSSMVTTMHRTMNEPDLMEDLTQGMHHLPEAFMKMAQAWTENMAGLLQESLSGMEQAMTDGTRQRPESSMEAMVQAYSLSLQKMLNMPKLGLNRYYQERLTQAMDRLNVFSVSAGEFSLQMLQPVESSLVKMQQKLKELAEGEEGYFEDAKDYYTMWIKMLEGDTMNLLQSPEFVKAFHHVVNTYMDFTAMFEEVMQDGLQFLPVTTKKDMEAVYRENYLLKKQVKAMNRRMEELEKKVEGLESGKGA